MNTNKPTISISDLILRFLRLHHTNAFDPSAIKSKIEHITTLIDEVPEEPITPENVAKAIHKSLNDGDLIQHNYHFYSISEDGMSYIKNKYPLFTIVLSSPKETP